MNHQRLFDIMSGADRSLTGHAARLGLSCLEPAYRLAVGARNKMFDWGVRKPKRLDRPVISVGNITTGGTGKTPMVIELAKRLIAMGERPAVLLRGYRKHGTGGPSGDRREESDSLVMRINDWYQFAMSDEAMELLTAVGDDVPIGVHPSRIKAARHVLEAVPQVTVFLLDDGFQHRQAHRDLEIVLIDATTPFGYGHLLPRGLLREPVHSLSRADAVIVTRADMATDLSALDARIEVAHGRPPIAAACHTWTGYRRHRFNATATTTDHPLDDLRDARVFGLCGIGNPDAFMRMLREQVGEVAGHMVLPDHHPIAGPMLAAAMSTAKEADAEAIVTTEKDWMRYTTRRLPAPTIDHPLPIYTPQLAIEFKTGGDEVDAMLRKALRDGGGSTPSV